MADYVLLFWAGFFLGFWACASMVVWYRIVRPRGWRVDVAIWKWKLGLIWRAWRSRRTQRRI
jgi:hypothetical protein